MVGGLTGIITYFSIFFVPKDQTTINSTSHSTLLEVGWEHLVLVGPSDIKHDSNFSVNVSSPDVNASFYTVPCSATVTHKLPQKPLRSLNPLWLETSPLNYNGFDIPLYALNGVLHYQCSVSSSISSPANGTCGAEIALFDNETYYIQSKNDDEVSARDRKCLEAGPLNSPTINNVTFELEVPSFYYITARVEVGFVVNCTAYGTLSLYDPMEIVLSNCALSFVRSWCYFNATDLTHSQKATDNLTCVLAQSNKLDVSTLLSNTTVTSTEDVTGRTNWFIFVLFISLSVLFLVCGCIAISFTCVCPKLRHAKSSHSKPM